ncbi:MAG: UDP-N-acetylmuramoyl-L-alanyl-D-glutamate--2,6-diaminopimelate ligase [Bacteroidota bacterium]
MKQTHLIQDLHILSRRRGQEGTWVEGIAFDSRQVKSGFAFVAVKGTQVDGHDYIEAAISQGCSLVIGEKQPAELRLPDNVGYLQVEDSQRALGLLASRWYDNPSRELKLVGVTGTNGKTTVATLLHDLFLELGYKAGLLSTIEVRINKERRQATHTTPDALAINAHLAEMVDFGVEFVFMEVSSHAVAQGRIVGIDFTGAVFTNISHDHLDYHGTFAAYLAAKKQFFDELSKGSFALVNIDDKRGEVMLQNTRANKYRYSLRQMADFRAKILDNSAQGLHLNINGHEVFTQFIGRFNALNLLAAYGAAVLLEQEPIETLTAF